ncbi:MAG TPA: hypothetical protein VFQ45_14165 [Longimicrobium sp.]|nr:hypothetical protein [Longimicrobium sp.]
MSTVAGSGMHVIEGAAEALGAYGTVRLSTDPISPRGPDLLFSPSTGPHAGCVYLVDYKPTFVHHYLPSTEIASSRSKMEGLHDVFPGASVHLVISTNGNVGNAGQRLAESADVTVIPGISTGAQLARVVAGIAGLGF